MADFHIANRPTAIVAGAHQRLGEAVARTLAAGGFQVVLTANEPGQCDELSAAIGGTALHVDVTSDVSVRSFVTQISHASVLVITGAGQPINTRAEADTHDWRWRWETRILGTLRMIKALRPHLMDSDGLIVTISAQGTANPFPGDDSSHLTYSERTLDRLVAAEIDGTSIRFTRIRPALAEDTGDDVGSVPAYRASLIVPLEMPPRIAQDIAEVVSFIATRPVSAPLFLEEVIIRPWAMPAHRIPALPVTGT